MFVVLCYYQYHDVASLHLLGIVHVKKEDFPFGSRCGSVETCRNALTLLPGTCEAFVSGGWDARVGNYVRCID